MVSSLPRRQRKAHFTATNVKRRKQMAAQVDPHLRDRMATKGKAYPRSLPVRKGDRVRVVRGQEFIGNNPPVKVRDPPRGRAHRVTGVNTRKRKIFVEGKTYEKSDGSKIPFPIDPSNVVIVNPDWSDPRRRHIISRINKLDAMTEEEYDEWERDEDEFEADEYEGPEEDEPQDEEPEDEIAGSADDEDVEAEGSGLETEGEADQDDETIEAETLEDKGHQAIEPETTEVVETPDKATSDDETESNNPTGEAVNENKSEEA